MAKTSPLHEYARVGAAARLTELQAEIAQLERMYPNLNGAARKSPERPNATAKSTDASPKRKRPKLSAAARKAISDAQKKRWAALNAKK
jgi:hypothetical protein